MADKGIFTAVSGAMAQSAKLETIANNIANANTTAFKRDQQVFQEYLTSYEKAPDVIQVPKVPASIESFYDHNGGDKSFVDVAGTYTDHTQGTIKPTGNPFDLALQGPGFFEILTPEGVQLGRAGNFIRNGEGLLVTKEGFPVLSEGAGDPSTRMIRIPEGQISVSPQGQIQTRDQMLQKLSVVEVSSLDQIKKTGGQRFAVVNDSIRLPAANQTFIQQGFVETSNVNIIREMTDMISTTRLFESTQKAIQAYDTMNGKMISDIPKL